MSLSPVSALLMVYCFAGSLALLSLEFAANPPSWLPASMAQRVRTWKQMLHFEWRTVLHWVASTEPKRHDATRPGRVEMATTRILARVTGFPPRCHILTVMTGRALVYLFFGSIMLADAGSALGAGVGAFLAFVGLAMLYVSRSVGRVGDGSHSRRGYVVDIQSRGLRTRRRRGYSVERSSDAATSWTFSREVFGRGYVAFKRSTS